MSSALADFKRFMQQREEAARAYVNGDAQPLLRLSASEAPATFFSPRGDFFEGAEAVVARYATDVASFAMDSDNTFQILQMAASDGLAYWVGLQRALVHMQGQAEPVPSPIWRVSPWMFSATGANERPQQTLLRKQARETCCSLA
ncbi:MAG: hypothetical protein H0X24_03835 [Ktedonobacterales bacterium]|nr:hypothetical protein [Ktedonobacterales bacterium]